jgi:septal ring factor EnvC (AmiA/AmiB activator)
VWKNRLIGFAVGLAVGILGTAGIVLTGRSGDPGEFASFNRANQRETERTIENLERVIGERQERIDDLEASNNRLETSNRDARRITEQLAISIRTEADDIRSAIELLKTVTDQVKSLNGVLGSGDTGGGGGGSLVDL